MIDLFVTRLPNQRFGRKKLLSAVQPESLASVTFILGVKVEALRISLKSIEPCTGRLLSLQDWHLSNPFWPTLVPGPLRGRGVISSTLG